MLPPWLISFAAVLSLAAASPCPPRHLIAPCACGDVEGDAVMKISCRGVRGPFNLTALISLSLPHMDAAFLFDELLIDDTSLLHIEPHALAPLRFKAIRIINNENLAFVSADAFRDTFPFTTQIQINKNYLGADGEDHAELFTLIDKFTQLASVEMNENRLRHLPEHAFLSHPALTRLSLYNNNFASLSARAFAGLPNLQKLFLFGNNFASSIDVDAFQGIGAKVEIDLQRCGILELDEGTFKPLLDAVRMADVGSGYCNSYSCSYTALNCNEKADWICANASLYKDKLLDFKCVEDGSVDVFDYCAAHFP